MKIDQSIFKAYDIRGIYPDQINEDIMYRIGQGYEEIIKPKKPVVVGCDVRNSSPSLKQALIAGLNDAGIDVIDIGLVSTEMYYFAVGYYGFGGGIQVTASHNPKEWNGTKMVREGVVPISSETGLFEIRDFVLSDKQNKSKSKGKLTQKDILDDFCNYLLSLIQPERIKPTRLAYNPNFGYEGIALKRLIEIGKLPLTLFPLNAEPDGNFPKGRPDPSIPGNRLELVELVKKEGVDLGVAWDADADRVFFCTDKGEFLDPCFSYTLLIKYMLAKFPNSKIIYDPKNTYAEIDAINQNGGIPIMERVGHSYIKARMKKENALFACETSGHTYYRDFWNAESGLLPLLQILEIISIEGNKFSELVAPALKRYAVSGEINFTVLNTSDVLKKAIEFYSDGHQSDFDGLICEYPTWRFSLRGSNTEPLLRLNVESRDKSLLAEKVVELTSLIESK